jgi:phage shock protein E
MNRFLMKSLLPVTVILIFAGTASAEIIKGRVKAIAPESALFSLTVTQEKVELISWDKKTTWQGVKDPGDLKLDEILSIDCSLIGGINLASSVSRHKTPLPAGIRVISLDRLTDGLAGKEITLMDTRDVEFYDAGHIPGAVSLPLSRLKKRTAGLLPEDKRTRLVFYDEGQGGNSAGKAAEISAKAGYSDIAIFPEGSTGWVDTGKILASSTSFIRKTRPAVIDIRSREEAAAGHIERAVNYPAAALNQKSGFLPKDKLMPIVIYGNSDSESLAAAEIIRRWGYRKVTIYQGGAGAWEKNAEVLQTGSVEEVISAAASTHGGVLQAHDFEMALISPVMVEIVDVRSAAEHKKGGFPGSRKITLPDLAKKLGELDRNKIQVVFAADPIRAEMAYDLLRFKGYRVNYLNGSVEFGKDGKHTVKQD